METQAAKNDKENSNPTGNVAEVGGPKIYTVESEFALKNIEPTFTFINLENFYPSFKDH